MTIVNDPGISGRFRSQDCAAIPFGRLGICCLGGAPAMQKGATVKDRLIELLEMSGKSAFFGVGFDRSHHDLKPAPPG